MQQIRSVRVSGRVQGVGFRWWTRRVASDLELVGTVRNCADGSVEVVAKGPVAALNELEQRLSEGPAMALVASVEQIPNELGDLPDGSFSILLDRD